MPNWFVTNLIVLRKSKSKVYILMHYACSSTSLENTYVQQSFAILKLLQCLKTRNHFMEYMLCIFYTEKLTAGSILYYVLFATQTNIIIIVMFHKRLFLPYLHIKCLNVKLVLKASLSYIRYLRSNTYTRVDKILTCKSKCCLKKITLLLMHI